VVIDTLEGVAKQILAVAGVLEGLYFHAIAFSNLRGYVSGWILFFYIVPIILLLISIVFALIVFLPETYRINIANWQMCKSTIEEISQCKLRAVRWASIFLGLAVLSLIVAVWMYLAVYIKTKGNHDASSHPSS
jgi:uncharacterized membrane protein